MTSASYYQAIYTIPAVGTSSGQQPNSNIVFNIIPPVSDAAGVTPNVFNSPYSGFAAFPINSVFSTLTGSMSQSPCKMDPAMDYAQITNFIQSPFGAFADDLESRNAYDINYVSNPPVPAGQQVNGSLTAAFIEPLIIPPLVYTEDWFYYPGFGGINQATINITVDNSTLQRVFRQARNDLVNWTGGVSVSIIGTPEIIVGFYSLPPTIKIPPILTINSVVLLIIHHNL
jgi:hypothetical protein